MNQGDVHWVELNPPVGSGPGFTRPCMVIQTDAFNRSNIRTIVVCVLTTNLRLGRMPGNVMLDAGEADLPQRSVVNTTHIVTLDKLQLGEYIGSLDESRVIEVFRGVQRLLEPREA